MELESHSRGLVAWVSGRRELQGEQGGDTLSSLWLGYGLPHVQRCLLAPGYPLGQKTGWGEAQGQQLCSRGS